MGPPADPDPGSAVRRPKQGEGGATLAVRDLAVAFEMGRAGRIEAVRGVSFDIPANATVALVGESGSGKSVTAMSLVRLLPDNAVIDPAGRVQFDGRNLLNEPAAALRAVRGKQISFVFQDPMTSLNPVFTVGDQIGEVLRLHTDLGGRALAERVIALLAEVGIPEPADRVDAFPHELSGGQQQRVMIAMAVACEPRLLIADEPTTALDVTVQRQILKLIAALQHRHHMSVLFISHDLGVVGEIADQVIVMRDGRIREQGAVADIFGAPQDPYTRALLACRPRLDVRPRRLPVIEDFMGGEGGSVAAARADPGRRVVPADAGAPLLEARALRKTYRLRTGWLSYRTIEAVRNASFALSRGRTLGLVGESGSGKSTVGMMLMRLTTPTAGEVWFDGSDLSRLTDAQMKGFRRRIQIVFQNPYASLNPRFSVAQILVEPMLIHGIGDGDADRLQRAAALLHRVGLPVDSLTKYPHEFSGGQRQRIAIARCLALQPQVLICDEAVSALDVSVQATVLNLLLDLQDEFGISYLFISHDLAVVRYMADDILVMNRGEVVERGTAESIYAAPAHPYTQRLLASIPRGYVGR